MRTLAQAIKDWEREVAYEVETAKHQYLEWLLDGNLELQVTEKSGEPILRSTKAFQALEGDGYITLSEGVTYGPLYRVATLTPKGREYAEEYREKQIRDYYEGLLAEMQYDPCVIAPGE